MKRIAVRFKKQQGESLSGNLSLPGRGEPRAFAVLAHCFTCSKSIRAANVICQQFESIRARRQPAPDSAVAGIWCAPNQR